MGFTSEQYEIDSCRLHSFQKKGRDGSTPIVFLHGLGTSSSTWIKVLSALRRKDTIACLDLPGHGFSKIKNGDAYFTLKQMDHALDQFINRFTALPVILVGHSLGGWLAARYAVDHPDRVRRLILINHAGVQYEGVEQQKEAFTINSVEDVRKLLRQMWYHYPWYYQPFTSSIYRSLKKKQITQFISSITEVDFLNPSLSSLTMPLDIFWGTEDRLISMISLEVMKQHVPQLKAYFIARCGHVPQLESPRALAALFSGILPSP